MKSEMLFFIYVVMFLWENNNDGVRLGVDRIEGKDMEFGNY